MILQANARALPLAARSVQCVVTSPPYFGLRDYGTAPLVWGGDASCDHAWGDAWCQTCGAWQGHLGLEPTPELYVQHLVEVFREVKRVLRNDGVLWLNLGDSYAANRSYQVKGGAKHSPAQGALGGSVVPDGLKPKDLIGIPWMAAFALRADGWYLRQDIIWHKPNPMPESVRDRCTKAHEYLFLLTKAERYYFDGDAIKQPCAEMSRPQSEKRRQQRMVRKVASVNGMGQSSKGIDDGLIAATHTMKSGEWVNRRSVWTIATKPYKGAHFAVFPESLVEPCVRAGSKPGDVVLDPFSGSGTTASVATRLQRRGVGVELHAPYNTLAQGRLQGRPPTAPTVSVPDMVRAATTPADIDDTVQQDTTPSPSLDAFYADFAADG